MRKIKVNINRPQANPEQVAGLQQFDQMLSMYKKAKYLFYAKVAAIITGVITVAAITGYLCLVKAAHGSNDNEVNKLSQNDPYASTMVESQYFELDASKDTVVEGAKGTVIAIPAGAFLDEDGNVVKGKVKLEIAEAFSAEDLIAGNISTDKNYGIQKALFVNATNNGKELNYNPAKLVIAEVPVASTSQPQVILDGTRNEQGEMSWTSRGPVKKYLVTMPLAQLDFLPAGFEEEVQKHMPYRGKEVADKKLVDSLYYSIDAHLVPTGSGSEAVGDSMTLSSYKLDASKGFAKSSDDTSLTVYYFNDHHPCIRPGSIKALKEPAYANTFIATREFEQRLQVIFTICDQSILNIYLDHLHDDLWISDSLAAGIAGRDSEAGKKFLAWSRLRCTNVKDAPATSTLLKQYYQKRQAKIEQQLLEAKEKYQKQLAKEDKQAAQVRENYSALLEDRFEYRLEKFGFEVKKNGMVAVATVLASLPTFELKVTVNGGDQFDHVHVYVVNPIVKSIFAMTSANNILFDGEYAEDPVLLMYEGQRATIIAVGYKDNKIYAAEQPFKQKKVVDIKVTPLEVSEKDYRAMISANNSGYTRENKIELDLEYQKQFYQEKLRQDRLYREAQMIYALVYVACPMSSNCTMGGESESGHSIVPMGKQIFENNCKACHSVYSESVGPALIGVSDRHHINWIRQFIRNSKALLKSGDPQAIAVYNKYGKAEMTAFPTLTDEEIDAILCYLNSHSQAH